MEEIQVKGNPLWDSSIPPWYVYRLHDKRDYVFYVGYSQALYKRLMAHIAFSWPVNRVTFETFDSKKKAMAEEKRVIKKLRPEYNSQPPTRKGRQRLVSDDFGDVIRDLRKAKSKSIRQLAQEVGISHSHLAYVERGERGASERVIKELAENLGVDMRDFLDG